MAGCFELCDKVAADFILRPGPIGTKDIEPMIECAVGWWGDRDGGRCFFMVWCDVDVVEGVYFADRRLTLVFVLVEGVGRPGSDGMDDAINGRNNTGICG